MQSLRKPYFIYMASSFPGSVLASRFVPGLAAARSLKTLLPSAIYRFPTASQLVTVPVCSSPGSEEVSVWQQLYVLHSDVHASR